MSEQMQASPEDLAKEAESVAHSALKGCPSETYALMSPLLNRIFAVKDQMDERFIPIFKDLVAKLLEAQKKDDLICISDYLGFEIPYILHTFRKQS